MQLPFPATHVFGALPQSPPTSRRLPVPSERPAIASLAHHRKFADGFPDLFVENATQIRNRHVAFLACFDNPAAIFEQISVIYALPRLFVGSFTLVLPFFPTGTMERVETEGDIATANTLARLLSNVPPSRGGPTSLVIFDSHALQVRLGRPVGTPGVALADERAPPPTLTRSAACLRMSPMTGIAARGRA